MAPNMNMVHGDEGKERGGGLILEGGELVTRMRIASEWVDRHTTPLDSRYMS